MKQQIDNYDKEAEREAKSLAWAKENLQTKSSKPYHRSKIIGIRGSQFYKVKE